MWTLLAVSSCVLAVTGASTIPAEYRQPSEYRQTQAEYRQARDLVGEVQHLVDAGMSTRTSRRMENEDSNFDQPIERSVRPARETQERSVRPARETKPARLSPYRFGYAVKDDEGNDYNQQEQSDGTKITGQYSVLLPDGRIQTVTYSVAPDTGFVADVSYSEAPGGAFGGAGGGNVGGGGNGGRGGNGGNRGAPLSSYGGSGK